MLGQVLPRLRSKIAPPAIEMRFFSEAKAQFTSLKKLGTGAFGTAWRAKYRGESVIVKSALQEGRDTEEIRTLAIEVKALERLQKFPFVPRLIEVGLDYFVQEDVHGVTFRSVMDPRPHRLARAPLDARQILAVTVSTGIMLENFRKEGIVHADPHPDNILLTPKGVVVIDFGIAIIDGVLPDLQRVDIRFYHDGLGREMRWLLTYVERAMHKSIPIAMKETLGEIIAKWRSKMERQELDVHSTYELSKDLMFVLSQLEAAKIRQGSANGKIKRPCGE